MKCLFLPINGNNWIGGWLKPGSSTPTGGSSVCPGSWSIQFFPYPGKHLLCNIQTATRAED
jgi:hypothetical protein